MFSLLNAQFTEWFLYPSNFPETYTGFSKGATDPLTDAEIMACWYEKVILKGDLYYYADSKSDGMVNEYYWWYDSQCVEDLKDSLFHLDGFITNIYLNSRVGLFSKHTKLE